jgi:anhydro-N-acetylmuramic acid kinase
MTAAWALGLMTGTVLDGMIDIAIVRTDGERVEEFGPWMLIPYPEEVRTLIADTLAIAQEWKFEGPEPPIFRGAEGALTQAQADAVRQFLSEVAISPKQVSLIGFHGQTVLHRAPSRVSLGMTRQLGDGDLMARVTGIDVAYDFRSADMRAGGQGAPLSATYHRCLLKRISATPEVAVLNLGGVGNLTWSDSGDLVAFDTGPANAPLNDWISRHGLGNMDRDGALAMRGKVDEDRLTELLAHPYFSMPYPKSLDRNAFPAAMVDGLNAADGAATLTALTASAAGKGLALLPERPTTLVVCGGGRKNPAIMDALRLRAGVTPLVAEDVGWRGDAIEAECFAYLAVRSLRGLPISYPLTTGVQSPMTGGRIAKATRT